MPYCPKCRYEYRPEITKCPECEEYLVAALSEDTDEDTINDEEFADWAPICRLTAQSYAELLVEALESKNITAIVYSGTGYFGVTGQMGPTSFQSAAGAYTVLVPVEMKEEAAIEASIILGENWEKVRIE